jgi:Na+/proline symporter
LTVPILERPLIALTCLFYLVVVLLIGYWSARRTRDEKDFFIAGQRVGLFVTAVAAVSSAFSGFVFVGGPGLTYRLGMASLWIILPIGYTGGMLCLVLAKRLRLLAEVREVFTIPDAIAARYASNTTTGLAALAVAIGSIAYLGAQLLALGVVLKVIFGLQSLALAMGAGLLVLVAYSVAGGMVAGVYTDVAQGGIMLVTAVAVFIQSIRAAGGWTELITSITTSEVFGPSFMEPLGSVAIFTAFGFYFVFGIGVLGQPQTLHKFFMLSDPAKLKWMPLVIGGSQALCLMTWVGIGFAVPALVAQGRLMAPDNPDNVSPLFLLHHAPELLAGLAFAGILAAIMSTSDSLLNISAAALVRDLPRALGKTLRHELFWARMAIPVVGLTAALLAYGFGDLIALLGTFAYGTFAAALVPALAIGLNWRGVTARAASASIATGMGVNLLLEFLNRQTFWAWLPEPPFAAGVLSSAVALTASLSVLFLFSVLSRVSGRATIAKDVLAVMDA